MQDLISYKSKANIIPINKTQKKGSALIIEALNKVSAHFPIENQDKKQKFLSNTIYKLELLNVKQDDQVLVLGAKSGIQSMVLAEMGAKVVTVTAVKEELLKNIDKVAGVPTDRIEVFSQEKIVEAGSQAPFDKIIISPEVKNIPVEFYGLLSVGGDMVITSDPSANPTVLHVQRTSATHFDTKKKMGLVDRSASYDVFDL